MSKKKQTFKPKKKTWDIFKSKFGPHYLRYVELRLDCSHESMKTKLANGFQKGDCHILVYYANVDASEIFTKKDVEQLFGMERG